MTPRRLRLSRKKGFNLQELSRAVNGLACVVVSRPQLFQNRWKIGVHSNHLGRAVETVEEAVECFRLLSGWTSESHMIAYTRERLAGHNLACWCALCDRHATGKPFDEECKDCAPCHADVLGALALPTPAQDERRK